jgi:hypothetical protein
MLPIKSLTNQPTIISYPIFLHTPFLLRSLDILMTVIGIVCSSPPLLLAWLTYDKMVKVLMENRDPHTKWAKTLEWLGYFLGLFIAGLMIYIANKKIEYSKHT